MTDKSKTSPAPPDIRLAKAFKFTGEDLAVNRSGYMSRRQEGSADIDYAVEWLLGRVFLGRIAKPKREFRPVNSVCGRARPRRILADIPPHHRGKMRFRQWAYYALRFDDGDLEFIISEEQFSLLAEGITYRVYYGPARPKTILSIERIDGGCDKE